MSDALSIALVVILFVILFVLCAIWHHITAMRYHKIKAEKGKQYKWYQLFGKLNEIGFWVKFTATVLFALILFVCLHYLCCTYPHKLEGTPDFDYFGVIAGFFAVLVTLLVGWQIYNTIKVKEEVDEWKKVKDETKQEVNKAVNRISKELWHLAPVFISAHSDFLHRFKTNMNIFNALGDDSLLAKSLSREFLLQSMMEIVKLSPAEQNEIIQSLKSACDKKHIENLCSEFYTYSDEERNGKYKGLNNLFLELLKD